DAAGNFGRSRPKVSRGNAAGIKSQNQSGSGEYASYGHKTAEYACCAERRRCNQEGCCVTSADERTTEGTGCEEGWWNCTSCCLEQCERRREEHDSKTAGYKSCTFKSRLCDWASEAERHCEGNPLDCSECDSCEECTTQEGYSIV
ncbi:hypothetical protein LTR95_012539, partial [Oleoguttula sp. CCFEE 5521]